MARYRRLYSVGVLCVILYGFGLPITFTYILTRYRHEIRADQLLRARNEGETALTNPHIRIRRRFRKVYEDYTPACRFV
jgi:hypothetical protein